jgi:pimeloyl-ACP methyl ester carboxylesterase
MTMFETDADSLTVQGCSVRYFRLGRPGNPPVMLVHGGGAHAGWWTAVAPLLAKRYDVVVPELSGHGGSGHREQYSAEIWVAELAEIAARVGWGSFDLVGHSMGGKVGVFLATHRPDVLDRLVMVDSAFRRPGEAWDPGDKPRSQHKVYPSLEDALARFRLRPGDTSAEPELLRLVARNALTEVPGGWAWKFDPRARQRITNEALHEELPKIRCRIAMVYGERSPLVGAETLDYVQNRLARPLPRVPVTGAYHHVPLDNPESCCAAIEELLPTLDSM